MLGSEPYVTAMITELQNIQGVSYQIADSKTIHTDTIMGKYHYVLEEQRSNDTLQCIKKFAKQRSDERMTVKNVSNRMVSMLLILWNVLDENYAFSLLKTCVIWGFSLLVSNLYGIMICILSKSEMRAGVLASSGAVLCTLLGGTFMAVTDMPQILQVFSKLSPISWLL